MSSAKAEEPNGRVQNGAAAPSEAWAHASLSHEQHPLAEAPFYRSIRFRLTAWYATILVLVLVAIGLALSTIVQRALEHDIQTRLTEAANEVYRKTDAAIVYEATDQGGLQQVVLIKPPQI